MTLRKIEDMVIDTVADLVESLSIQGAGNLNKETVLFGDKGILDSMALVSLITDLEEKLEKEFNLSVDLADERALSQKKSPFRTVSSLASYIFNLVKDADRHEEK